MATNFQENKKIAKQSFEAFEKNDTALLEKITDTNKFQLHFPGYDKPMNYQESLKVQEEYHNAFPDAKATVEEQIAEGNYVVSRLTYTGTHKGEMQGVAPSNKKIKVSGVAIQKIENGKITEEWDAFDALGMMQQIGAIPETAAHETQSE